MLFKSESLQATKDWLERIKLWLGIVAGILTAGGGAYTIADKLPNKRESAPILTWEPSEFRISSGPADSKFRVIAARKKHRDDCTVTNFTVEVKDSSYVVYSATPSIQKFAGPAGPNVEKFSYFFTIDNPKLIAPGFATLLAQIEYKCPEGTVIISYPNHRHLTFEILEPSDTSKHN